MNEFGLFRSAAKVVIHNPDNPAEVRQVSGTNSPRWINLNLSPTFSECVTTMAQLGTSGFYTAQDLPAGLDARRQYEFTAYGSSATAFSDVPDERGRTVTPLVQAITPDGKPIALAKDVAAMRKDLEQVLRKLLAAMDPVSRDSETGAMDAAAAVVSADYALEAAELANDRLAAQAETLSDLGEAINGIDTGVGTGDGDVAVNHNYGGDDELQILDDDDEPIDNAKIDAYLATDTNLSNVVARTFSGSDGRWIAPLNLDADDYVLVISKPGQFNSDQIELTVEEP